MYEYKGYAAKVCASDLDANGVGAQLSTTLKLKQRHYNLHQQLPSTLKPLLLSQACIQDSTALTVDTSETYPNPAVRLEPWNKPLFLHEAGLPLTLPPLRDNDGLPGRANQAIFVQLRGNPKALLELGQDTCIPLPLWTPVADLGHKVSKLLCH